MTKISMIAAMDKNRVIGNGDEIPWHIPEDFKYFKAQTLGKPIVMGRATFESIHAMKGSDPHGGSALPKRQNIIITRQNDYIAADCIVCPSVDSGISAAKSYVDDANEVMIIGGGTIYEQALPFTDRLYITIVDGEYEGDVFFPQFDKEEWHETSCDPHDGYTFYIYDRIV